MTLHHGDTEARAKGLEAVLERGFERVRVHFREIAMILVTLLVIAAAGVGFYEVGQRRESAAQTALARIQTDLIRAMGGRVQVALNPEPANAESARRAREAALVALEAMMLEHAGRDAVLLAGLHAAELEVDVGRPEAAAARLVELAGVFAPDDPRRAIALRLRGYALEELGRPVEAGEAYYEAAGVQTYPARAHVYITAGDVFARGGASDRAVAAFQQAMALAPELAEDTGLVSRVSALETLSARDLGLTGPTGSLPVIEQPPDPEPATESEPEPAPTGLPE